MEFWLFIMVSSAWKNTIAHHFREKEPEKYEAKKLAVKPPIREKRLKDSRKEDFGELCK